MPLPQPWPLWQSGSHASPAVVLPSSHFSPHVLSRMPLPQVSFDLQFPEQPSPSVMLPSSQSSPTSTLPLPQFVSMHTGCTAAHCSGEGHTMPVAHVDEEGGVAQPAAMTSPRMNSLFNI